MTNESAPQATPDGADPSMEEILASIRRILNDDEVPPVADALPAAVAAPAVAAVIAEEDDDDVLILDEAMMVAPPGPEAHDFEVETTAPAAFEPPALPPVAEPLRPEMEVRPLPVRMETVVPATELLGPEAAAAAASSVDNLVRTLSAGRATQVYSGGPTLEDMVRAELRPLLKEWLDTYLPPMVERLVRSEIERVVARFVP